jgi:hypothetical protein
MLIVDWQFIFNWIMTILKLLTNANKVSWIFWVYSAVGLASGEPNEFLMVECK